MAFVEKKFIKSGVIEEREYQTSLAREAASENCIVVLPTGLGKTAVALHVMADYLDGAQKAILFMAPTRVLVNQHHDSVLRSLTIGDIGLVTGEDTIKRRVQMWQQSIVCATPEITRNDMEREIVSPKQFGLVIFDEVHRTVGDYAYSGIAKMFADTGARLLGMTATLPSEKTKADQIMESLGIRRVLQRTENSPDVSPYVHKTETEWVRVELPATMASIRALINVALEERYAELNRRGAGFGKKRSLSALLGARTEVLARNRMCAKPLFTAIRITYALNIFEAHGITPFLRFCERTEKKKGAGIRDLFAAGSSFARAIRLAKAEQARGLEHPKLDKLLEVVRQTRGKTLVFTSYRDSVDIIHKRLQESGIKSGILIGKAGETGISQKKQVQTVQEFRDGLFDVMVATRVGEEGLDISEVNLVVFFDNVPSSIRYVQRRGRTGRRGLGRLVVLIAKDTIDERYYWIGRNKIKAAGKMGAKMMDDLKKGTREIESEKNKPDTMAQDGLDRFV